MTFLIRSVLRKGLCASCLVQSTSHGGNHVIPVPTLQCKPCKAGGGEEVFFTLILLANEDLSCRLW